MKFRLVILFVFQHLSALAQMQENVWEYGYSGFVIFGGGGSINFSSGSPVQTFNQQREMMFANTNTSICDSFGNLLFYTNGQFIANRRNDSLQNTNNFNPGDENTEYFAEPYSQSIVILPDPAGNKNYYVVGTSGDQIYSRGYIQDLPLNIRYSIVDMNIDSGYGGIDPSHKAVIILNDSLNRGHITACKHGNGRDWWVVFHQFYTDMYYKILITPISVEGPLIQHIGSILGDDLVGQSCFTADGLKYACIQRNGNLDIFDFNRCTGQFSNAIHVQVPQDPPYYFIDGFIGCAFSPSGKYLYVDDDKNLYQYDVQSSDIDGSRQLIANYYALMNDSIDSDSFDLFSGMQQSPDNKIYIGTWNGSGYMHVINDPDSNGVNCNFKLYGLSLLAYNVDVPTYPNYQLGRLKGSDCDTLTSIKPLPKNLLFNLFPNPVNSDLIIQYSSSENLQCEIFDITGRIITHFTLYPYFKSRIYDVSKIPQGIYIVKVEDARGNSAERKFVKE